MAVGESKRRANDKWDAANMAVMSCKLKRDAADAFKAACAAAGTTPNAVFRSAIDEFMDAHGGPADGQDTAREHTAEHPTP